MTTTIGDSTFLLANISGNSPYATEIHGSKVWQKVWQDEVSVSAAVEKFKHACKTFHARPNVLNDDLNVCMVPNVLQRCGHHSVILNRRQRTCAVDDYAPRRTRSNTSTETSHKRRFTAVSLPAAWKSDLEFHDKFITCSSVHQNAKHNFADVNHDKIPRTITLWI